MFDQPATQIQSDQRAADFSPRGFAECRAAAYALLANGLRYPEDSLVKSLGNPRNWDAWISAIEPISTDLGAELSRLRQELDGAGGRSCPPFTDELRAAYGRLFGHSVRGTCPPYELEYGRSEIIQQTAELADLTGFYRAFGMDVRESAFERADHVTVECEFLSVLCVKEAWGRQQDHPDLTEMCADAQRLFLRDHLGKWLPAFAHRVMKAEPESFYGRLASFAASFVADECRRFDIEVGPQWLELRPVDPACDAAIDCETAGCSVATANQLVQIGIESQTRGER